MIHSWGYRALLWFEPKRVYIRASSVSFDSEDRIWHAHNGDSHHFDGLGIDADDKHRGWSADLISSAEENIGVVRYYNQIRTCPLCGSSDVTYGGCGTLFREDPRRAFAEASFLRPHIFSPCKNASRCRDNGAYSSRSALLGALLAGTPQDREDRNVQPSQLSCRLGVSSHDDEFWFWSLREGSGKTELPASEAVDLLLSKVWVRESRRGIDASALPRPAEINPALYPLPKDEGVYFLYCGNRVVYVGQSGTANSRVKEHKRTGKSFDSVAFVPVQGSTARLSVERHYIGAFNPELNKV